MAVAHLTLATRDVAGSLAFFAGALRWRAIHRPGNTGQPISYFMRQAVENPDLITLAAGLVDPCSLPAGPVAAALDTLLGAEESARAALQYGTTQGYAGLRELLVRRTAALDGRTPEEL